MTKHRQGVRNTYLAGLSRAARALATSRGAEGRGGRCLPGVSVVRAAATCPTCIVTDAMAIFALVSGVARRMGEDCLVNNRKELRAVVNRYLCGPNGLSMRERPAVNAESRRLRFG